MASPPTATPSQPPPLQPFQPSPFVPALLETTPQWICWKAVWRSAKGKWDKLPVSVVTGSGMGFLEAKNQVGYDEAVRYAERHNLSGVGFVLMGSDILGIDLDSCRDPTTGELEPWAGTILARARTYAEISPSLRGIRLFTLGDLGGRSMIKSSPAKVEMYASGRYLTFTGNHLPGTPYDVEQDLGTVQALKDRVDKITLLTGSPVPAGTPAPAASQAAPAPGSDEEFRRYAYSQTFFGKVNKLAMENLPEWVPELFPTAERLASGVWRVKSKDLGRDLEEDISISPDGIVDFGEHDMGDAFKGKRTPVDLTILWHGKLDQEDQDPTTPLTKTEAVFWLCKKLGVDPKTQGYRGVAVDNGDNGDSAGTTGTEPAAVKLPPVRRIKATATLTAQGRKHVKAKIILPGFERGGVTLVGGPSGAMKSLLMQQIAVALITGQAAPTGESAIDYIGSVIYYANEDAPEELMKRYDAILRFHNLGTGPFPHELMLWTGRILLRRGEAIVVNPEEVKELEAAAKDGEIAVLVVDTLAAALVSEETNKEFQQTMNLLKALAEKLNVAVAVIHHFRKGQPGGKDEETTLESMRGGSTLTASARHVLFVEPPSKAEAKKYGFTDTGQFLRLTDIKASNRQRVPPRWFRREVVDIDVVDERNGSPGTEGAPALAPCSPNAGMALLAQARVSLAKLEEAEAAGTPTRWQQRDTGRADSAQTVLGMDTVEADKVLTELERLGAIERVRTKDPLTRNFICKIRILPENLRNKVLEDEDVEDAEESGL